MRSSARLAVARWVSCTEGWDPIIARRVAIKTVKLPEHADDPETEEALARFRREAQAAGRLTHPNIVGVFDYGETNDLAYIVMEFVDGPPLKNLLDKQERFALTDTVRVMEDLLAGLQFSHDRGVVHRDIKPANVMLTSGGQAKIADFGIARIESSSMTQAGTLLGTPAYMSPEQFMGQVVDARTDIYSSGVLLYQLLTGERPFEGGLSAIMHKALNTEPPWPSQLSVTAPHAFDTVVKRAMAKRPDDRFPSATAFAEAIRAAMTAPAGNPRNGAGERGRGDHDVRAGAVGAFGDGGRCRASSAASGSGCHTIGAALAAANHRRRCRSCCRCRRWRSVVVPVAILTAASDQDRLGHPGNASAGNAHADSANVNTGAADSSSRPTAAAAGPADRQPAANTTNPGASGPASYANSHPRSSACAAGHAAGQSTNRGSEPWRAAQPDHPMGAKPAVHCTERRGE